MKHLSLIVLTLCAMVLSMPDTGFAYNNEIGFYTDMEQSAVNINTDQSPVFNLFVMLNNPYNDDLDLPVETIGAFEFQVDIPPGLFVLSSYYPVSSLNVGNDPHEYIVGFGYPLEVTSGTPTLLVTFQVFATSTGPDQFIYLSPTTPSSIYGEIAYYDSGNETIIPMNNVIGGEFTNPIFAINPTEQIVAVDHISFDAVKALYR